MDLDPLDHQHLILGFGSPCIGQASAVCFAETTDGGSNWKVVTGKTDWKGGSSRTWFLDAKSRLYSSDGDGLWRTADNGTLYIGGVVGIFRSTDSLLWSVVASNTQQTRGGVASDGTTLFASSFGLCTEWGHDLQLYVQSAVTEGKMWSPLAAPPMTQGAVALEYDRAHHILYSSNCRQGFWRVVTP